MQDGSHMSAALFGASLLEDVQEESLDQLFSDLRYSLEPEPRNLLGVPAIDRLLDLFRYPDGSATEPYASGSTFTQVIEHDELDGRHIQDQDAGVINRSGPPAPGFIELSNNSSGTTGLLYHITAASILPKAHGGKEAAVVWLDTNSAFSAIGLYQACLDSIEAHRGDSISTVTAEQRLDSHPHPHDHDIAHNAMNHVHIFSISSTKQLLSVLDNLEPYLLQTDPDAGMLNHHSTHRALSLLVLDSATSFQWSNRAEAETARLLSSIQPHPQPHTRTQNPTPIPTLTTLTQQTISRLKTLQTTFHNVVLYTTTTTPKPTQTDDTDPLSPWTMNATLSLTLTRLPVPSFPTGQMDLADCLRDRDRRQEVVRRGRTRVEVARAWFDRVVRDKRVRERVRQSSPSGSGFVFYYSSTTGWGLSVE